MDLVVEEPVYRPPVEASSLILQVVLGCPWNKCLFCYLYKTRRFRVRPLNEVLKAIEVTSLYFRDLVYTIFLADGNVITLRNEYLLRLLNALYRSFPNLVRVSCYGGARFIVRKGLARIRELAEAGLRKVYLGLESGDDEVLKFMNKGATVEDMIKASDILHEAGIELSTTIILGLAGKGRGVKNGEMTARAINAMRPDELRIHTLILSPYAPLFKHYLNGSFKEADWREVLIELKTLLENIDVPLRVYSHASNYIYVSGRLPNDKERMLRVIEKALENPSLINFERCL
ncbi:MAG: radical SAM protein [Thermoprotei archaeon]|mgnify:CR=1 FL=1|nr:MAG: radical SAM protein [Thermoprotei archaeon]